MANSADTTSEVALLSVTSSERGELLPSSERVELLTSTDRVELLTSTERGELLTSKNGAGVLTRDSSDDSLLTQSLRSDTVLLKGDQEGLQEIIISVGKGAPEDPWNLYFIAFMILGAGFHLPFNSFVAAVDYFMMTYKRDDMAFIVASCYTYTVCGAVLLNVLLVNKVSTHTRIQFGYLAFLVSLLAMAALVGWTLVWGVTATTGYLVTVTATILTGLGCGIQEASYYGYAGMLPPRYTRAIMLGEAFAGLVVCLNRIVTKLTIEDALTNTILFFSLSIVGEVVCVVLHRQVRHSSFIKYYAAGRTDEGVKEGGGVSSTTLMTTLKDGLILRVRVAKKIWKLMLGILNVYFTTFLLYPGLTSVVHSTWPDGWLAVVLITAFNLSYFTGTMATGCRYRLSENMLLVAGVARWLLIPTLLLCVVGGPVIPGEVVPLMVIMLLGFTTGHMGSTPMCGAAKKLPHSEREMGGNLMTMMMLLGMSLGSTVALVINGAVGAESGME